MKLGLLHTAFRMLVAPSLAALALLAWAGSSEAQTYRFNIQPYCDVVVLTLVPTGSPNVLSVVGYDDNCGDLPYSPIHGTAVMNPNGTVTIGYTTVWPYSVYQNTDVASQVSVEIPPRSNVGSWTDDDGNSGTFEFDLLDQKSG